MLLAWLAIQGRRWAPGVSDTVYFSAAGAALLFLLIGFIWTADRLLWTVVLSRIVRLSEDEAGALHQLLRSVLMVLGGLLYLMLMSLVGVSVPLVAAVIVLVILSALTLGSSIWRMHQRLERLVMSVFDTEQPLPEPQAEAAQEELMDLIRERYSGQVETEDFILPQEPSAVNTTIRQLRLRSETGASIVAVYRDNAFVPNPSPDTELTPGSVLLLMGRREQIERAFAHLRERMRQPAR
jgi:hypothetical protein